MTSLNDLDKGAAMSIYKTSRTMVNATVIFLIILILARTLHMLDKKYGAIGIVVAVLMAGSTLAYALYKSEKYAVTLGERISL